MLQKTIYRLVLGKYVELHSIYILRLMHKYFYYNNKLKKSLVLTEPEATLTSQQKSASDLSHIKSTFQ